MTLKQRLELLCRQNEEMLSLMRQLARGRSGKADKDAPAERYQPPPRRWNEKGGHFEIYLHGSGWIRDFDNRPSPGGGR